MKSSSADLLWAACVNLGLAIPADSLGRFDLLLEELRRWSGKINLTALRNDRDIVLKHFADSLALLRVVDGGSLLDVGSGAGFPSLPLKMVLPGLEVVSVDAVEKKIRFQRHMVRLLGIKDYSPLHLRVEALPSEYYSHFDCAVSRALCDIPSFCSLVMPLLKDNGIAIAMKGKRGEEEAEASVTRLHDLGLEIRRFERYCLPFADEERSLVIVGRKVP